MIAIQAAVMILKASMLRLQSSPMFGKLSFVIFPRFEWKRVQAEILRWKMLTGKQKKMRKI